MFIIGAHWSTVTTQVVCIDEYTGRLAVENIRDALKFKVAGGQPIINYGNIFKSNGIFDAMSVLRDEYINVGELSRARTRPEIEVKKIVIMGYNQEYSLYEICYIGGNYRIAASGLNPARFNVELVSKEILERMIRQDGYRVKQTRDVSNMRRPIAGLEDKLADNNGKSECSLLMAKIKLLGKSQDADGNTIIHLNSYENICVVEQCAFKVENRDNVSYIEIQRGVQECSISIGRLFREGKIKNNNIVIRSLSNVISRLSILDGFCTSDINRERSRLSFDIPKSRIRSLESLAVNSQFEEIDLSGLRVMELVDVSKAFANGYMSKVILGDIDFSHVVRSSDMFCNCASLERIEGLDKAKFSSIRIAEGMFCGCMRLEDVSMGELRIKEDANLKHMYAGCDKIRELDLSNSGIWRASNFAGMFEGCKDLEDLVLPDEMYDTLIKIRDLSSSKVRNIFAGVDIAQKDSNTNKIIDAMRT